jgi:ankyrin repeat protein
VPLLDACYEYDLEKMRALIRAGVDVNERTPEWTPLIAVCTGKSERESSSEGIRILIDAGADVNAVDHNGHVAYMVCSH